MTNWKLKFLALLEQWLTCFSACFQFQQHSNIPNYQSRSHAIQSWYRNETLPTAQYPPLCVPWSELQWGIQTSQGVGQGWRGWAGLPDPDRTVKKSCVSQSKSAHRLSVRWNSGCEAERKTEPELGVQLHLKTTVTHPYDPAVVLFRLEREAAAIIIETASSTWGEVQPTRCLPCDSNRPLYETMVCTLARAFWCFRCTYFSRRSHKSWDRMYSVLMFLWFALVIVDYGILKCAVIY